MRRMTWAGEQWVNSNDLINWLQAFAEKLESDAATMPSAERRLRLLTAGQAVYNLAAEFALHDLLHAER